MKSAPLTQSKVKMIVSEIQQHHKSGGEPISLNELLFWKPLSKSQKIKIGRGFKKMVVAGEIEGIKFVGVRADNHSTYLPTGRDGRFFGFLGKIFR